MALYFFFTPDLHMEVGQEDLHRDPRQFMEDCMEPNPLKLRLF